MHSVSVPFRGFMLDNALECSLRGITEEVVSVPFRGFMLDNTMKNKIDYDYIIVSVPFRGFMLDNPIL